MEPDLSPSKPAAAPSRKIRLPVLILLLAFVILCVTSVGRKSATYDETHYLGAGRYLLTTHRWDLPDSLLHPVFWTVWHDLPLLTVSAPRPRVGRTGRHPPGPKYPRVADR